jgi:hypothetical protein
MEPQTRQLECLSCSNIRTFVHVADDSTRQIGQAEAVALPWGATIKCARCGSTSLIHGWNDAIPDASPDELRRRGRPPKWAGAESS